MEEEQPEPVFEEQEFTEEEPEPAPPPPPPLQQPSEGLVSPQAAETVCVHRLNEKLNEDYHELPIGNGAITLGV